MTHVPCEADRETQALRYANQGLALLPIERGTKQPNARTIKRIHGTTSWTKLRQPASPDWVHSWFEDDPCTDPRDHHRRTLRRARHRRLRQQEAETTTRYADGADSARSPRLPPEQQALPRQETPGV